jgi:RimJ/RimL family protein N-acetyltransferase
VTAPVIETERLRLRGYTLADLARFTEIWGDARVVVPLGAQPSSREEACGRMLRYVGHWALRGFGTWAVEQKATGGLIGEVGLFDYERDLPPGYAGLPEHGWAFAPEAQGKGYATEAVLATLDWGVRRFNPFKPFCIIAEQNQRSLRLAARAGYREALRSIFHGRSAIVLRRD